MMQSSWVTVSVAELVQEGLRPSVPVGSASMSCLLIIRCCGIAAA